MKKVVDEIFYYHRDIYNNPIVTICLIRDSANKFHRGISFCAYTETPNKKFGKGLAFARALEAMLSREDGDNVGRALYFPTMCVDIDKENKSEYDVSPTSYEMKRMFNFKPGMTVTIAANSKIYDAHMFRMPLKTDKVKTVKCLRVEKDDNGDWYLTWKGHRGTFSVFLDAVMPTR